MSDTTADPKIGKYAICSHSEFILNCLHDSEEAALEEVRSWALQQGHQFSIGKVQKPTNPEDGWSAESWLEAVACQDDYDGGEAWPRETREQREELEAEVRPILAAWLDRHGLRPTHYLIDDIVDFRVTANGFDRLPS